MPKICCYNVRKKITNSMLHHFNRETLSDIHVTESVSYLITKTTQVENGSKTYTIIRAYMFQICPQTEITNF